ncbi:SDR family oxidoreductase [Nocardia sp. SYP-A9097]|uniref:SDR family oxidoreductase n=1 Tax=Nocardia sp. SYP-A9097 TaxID=2663237 RepID=UPI001891D92C|nr:SDR family oxidoreductase [Nocardia sp. SYP-A9097]
MATNSSVRAVLITGATGGIGKAAAIALADKGFHIYAGVRTATPELDVNGITQIRIDVTDTDSIAAAVAAVTKRQDGAGLYALINNAGVLVQGPVELVPPAELRRQFQVNVAGPVQMIQAFLPLLREGGGRIINISAASARVSPPFLGPIGASKAALESFSDSLRVELAPWGIPVSVIQPGAMRTEIFAKSGAAAQESLAQTDPRRVALYERQFVALDKAMAGQRFAPVDVVVGVIRAAVVARSPKAYYTAGSDARQAVWLSRLSPRLRDRLVARVLGVSGIQPTR